MTRWRWKVARSGSIAGGAALAVAAMVWAPEGFAQGTPSAAPGAAAPAPAAPAAEPTPAVPTAADVATLDNELLTIEDNVDELKERVFRAKATLQLLKEIVMEGQDTGARAAIWHVNKLAGGWRLESVQVQLDGQTRFAKTDPSGGLDASREFKVQDGSVEAGQHTVAVEYKVRPTGLGVFSYVKNYEIDLRSSYAFSIDPGRSCTIRSVLAEKSAVAQALEDRVGVSFEFKCERMADANPVP